MSTPPVLESIPHPPALPLVGNLRDVASDFPIERYMELARQYGPIYALKMPRRTQLIVLSSHALVDEVCDDTRFDKALRSGPGAPRQLAGDGLFTAATHEPNWRKAHNILMPSFGIQAIRGYLPQMWDVCEEMLRKWERLNPDEDIDVPGDMTRLTLDTIGLCGFNYRLNSFYRESEHPLVASIASVLAESQRASQRLPVRESLKVRAHRRFRENIDDINGFVDTIIRERQRGHGDGPAVHDLLDAMLHGVDRASGDRLDDVNIRYQIITFLIAGHETTSSLLSFALAALLAHPKVLTRAREEVDRVLGDDVDAPPTAQQMDQLVYVGQVLKESLRLWSPVPFFRRYALQRTVIGGRYVITPEQQLVVLVAMLHRDPAVWGDRAEQFDPDNFSPDAEEKRPVNAFKPFGTGQRSCIGRQFAMQEATLAVGKMLQRFELVDHTRYRLKIRQALTLKPADFPMRVRARHERHARTGRPVVPSRPGPGPGPGPGPAPAARGGDGPTAPLEAREARGGNGGEQPTAAPGAKTGPALHHTPLLVLYGSNLGTTEAFARQLGEDARLRGFRAEVAQLDKHVDRLPRQGALVVLSASYNGAPPDNAERFCGWLKGGALSAAALGGVRYAVFGCGHRDWAQTYQSIPTLIDTELASHGAERLCPRGVGDAKGDIDGAFRAWEEELWNVLSTALKLEVPAAVEARRGPRYRVEVLPEPIANPFVSSFGALAMRLHANRELQRKEGPTPSERSTRHIELELPAGVAYHAGDHLGVIPHNPLELVGRVLQRFQLTGDARVKVHDAVGGKTVLPIEQPVALTLLVAQYVELQDAATRPQLGVLAEHTRDGAERDALLSCSGDDEASVARYRERVLEPHRSLLDVLEAHPSCELPFDVYLEMLPALRPRYYSISSSPLVDPRHCSITVGVVDSPARGGDGRYRGVCSSYLAARPLGSFVFGFVRDPSTPFRPPKDPAIPIIMVGAGTGLAPFRGFLQERAVLKSQGRTLGPSLLVFGCRSPQADFLYEDELRLMAAQGVTELQCAFSRLEGQGKVYVQDRLRASQSQVWALLEQGAIVYVCGEAGHMAKGVRAAYADLYCAQTGKGAQEAETWLAELTAKQRYVADVWGGT